MFGEGDAVMAGEIRFFWNMETVDALQEDVDAVHDRIALGYKTGIYMLDEAREKVGLDPVGPEKGGEEFFTAAPPVEEEEEEDEETLVEKRQKATNGHKPPFPPNEFLTDGQKKTFNYAGLELRREPTETEKGIDLKAIADSFDTGAEALAKVLLGLRTDLIDQAASSIPKLKDSNVFTLTLTPPKNAYKLVEKILARAVEAGREQVHRDWGKSGAKGAYGVKSLIDDLVKRLVELTVSRIINSVQTAAIDIFASLGVLGLDVDEIEQRMREELEERSDKPFEGFARQAVNEAVNAGRREEMEARADEIEKYVYSAILDANTCEPCEDWDGAEADDPAQLPETPNAECEGRSNCRCFIISIFTTEAI
jgi:hypothetical protein